MPATPPDTRNYVIGGSRVIVNATSVSLDSNGLITAHNGVDLGNIVSLAIDPTDITVLQHFTARSGSRKMDKQVVTQKRLVFRIGLDEHAKETYQRYFMGSVSGDEVRPLTQPLAESPVFIHLRNETKAIWNYSHTKASIRPSGAMDFGEFDDFAGFAIEVEALFDESQTGKELGTFVFVPDP